MMLGLEDETDFEYRCGCRIPVTLEILLYQDGVPVVRCKTRNVDDEGMFVVSGAVRYQRHTMLDVEFDLTLDTGRKKGAEVDDNR